MEEKGIEKTAKKANFDYQKKKKKISNYYLPID